MNSKTLWRIQLLFSRVFHYPLSICINSLSKSEEIGIDSDSEEFNFHFHYCNTVNYCKYIYKLIIINLIRKLVDWEEFTYH